MSVSKWAYSPERCDGDYCPGDCDRCSKPITNCTKDCTTCRADDKFIKGIVHCKDCRYQIIYPYVKDSFYCGHAALTIVNMDLDEFADFFCALGEKKDG